jgi:hypothetical protein
MTSTKSAWKDKYLKDASALGQIAEMDPFRDWDHGSMPEMQVELDLGYAVEILLGDGDTTLARRFLARSVQMAERARMEDKLISPLCKVSFPGNRARMVRAAAYAEGLLGEPLDAAGMLQVARDFHEDVSAPGASDDEVDQADHLSGVTAALIGGDQQLAACQIRTRRRFKWHPQRHRLLLRIASATTPLTADDLAEFDAYFDPLRHPGFKSEIYLNVGMARLEMSVLRSMYYIRPGEPLSWDHVLEQIRA